MSVLDSITAISSHAFDDEHACITRMLPLLASLTSHEQAVMDQATRWTSNVRQHGAGNGMEAFLHTYGLDTREGVALMCLAEALLRIPDRLTADRLIHDTFENKQWRSHLEGNEPWLIGASSWGLLLAGKVIDFGDDTGGGMIGTLQHLTAKIGEPVIREALKKAMRMIGSQFVLGENVQKALDHSAAWTQKQYRFSYDMLGEGARSDAQAKAYVQAYADAVRMVGTSAKGGSLFERPGISVKLSALHPRYSMAQRERVMKELLPRLTSILLLAKEQNIVVSIDAEEANRLDMELLLIAELMTDPAFAGWNGIGIVVQAYQKRALYVIDWLENVARAHGRIIPLRLVKGAYWDSEIKHAQMMGLPDYPVFTRKEYTDVSYLACAGKILSAADAFYPQFATHNARTIATLLAMTHAHSMGSDAFEFQRLHGMGEALHDQLVGEYRSRIYAPIGEHKDLLAYLIRRLLENGANSSFVHLLMDPDVPLNELLADPLAKAQLHPESSLPRPSALYGDRANSAGADLGYLSMRESMEASLHEHAGIAATIPLAETTSAMLHSMIEVTAEASHHWAMVPSDKRCRIVESIADKLEEQAPEFRALLVEEAGKTLPDAIAEVREAADFCRYYALQARKLLASPLMLTGPTGESNNMGFYPRGVFACISPWNFPLAIFTGQIVAALVSGNGVIAKPSEQTPRIAQRMVSLMQAAGIPKELLQLAVGKGSVIGPVLTTHSRIDGVVFTGSVEVAKAINQSLASRAGAIVPFIAETGGQNCMVVDSSALIEQAVDDIIASAFGSAGQRCSALRVLYVQEEIADALMTLLGGAMQEVVVGNPMLLSTDIGPVIDANAQTGLLAHIARMKQEARLIAAAPAASSPGYFVAPHAFEITSIRQLEKEHFGPILHVIRFAAGERGQVAEAINSTGYGLTFGIHSRVEETIQFFLKRVRAGNYYVNRSMTGAVVGVQPFGGEGLSGTGPKAGGPHYLLRFMVERSVAINSAAIGGNVALLSR